MAIRSDPIVVVAYGHITSHSLSLTGIHKSRKRGGSHALIAAYQLSSPNVECECVAGCKWHWLLMMLSEEGFALVSVSMEALLYGVYVVLFIFALALLTWYRRPLSTDWFVLAVTTLLFALCTAHVVLEAMGKLSPLEKTSHPNLDIHSLRVAANFLYGIISFVSQFILIFRCWAIWDHCKRIVFLPITISVASLACIMTRQGLTASTYSPSFMSSHLTSLDTSSFSLSLALDVLVTSLIIFRLWRMSSEKPVFCSS
ncbi:hypothetical protein A0H81_02399 [Grifola frondosa]|uniref:Uncharacterized protein n=1 Tax=Grifola frondosa TaxID=5627 RepID=A0A1C7MNF9_GRIFR|nr:hypothetical protein A0H81_02399 [Grifola frondosa]